MNNYTTTRTIFFWSISFTILLSSIIFPLYFNYQTNSTNFLKRVISKNCIQDFFFVFEEITRSLLLHSSKCENSKWSSKLISLYGVSHVLTVDLNGCANFSTIQKAVDSVPDDSSTRTLILVDSGTYK